MFILLTGAFGNIGESTLLALIEQNHQIRCFDLPTTQNEKTAKRLQEYGDFEPVWGDVRDADTTRNIVEDVDCIIHLAAILPPASERDAKFTHAVNVGGTVRLIEAAEALPVKPKFIYASSVSVFGPTMHLPPPRKVDDLLNPTDIYTTTKFECETALRASALPWTILRLVAVPGLRISGEMDPILFEIPLDQRIEFVHTRDVGTAFANVVNAKTSNKVLLIGGGKTNQMLQRDFIAKILNAMGIGMLPESAFRVATQPEDWYYTDWVDTTESQHLLHYQHHTYDQYLDDLKHTIGFKRHLARLFRGFAKKRILAQSPYYQKLKNH
ncbi:MAG: NAD(P)-dependent oxidoreductase [Candidatus Hermodarchaeota archaeon]|nr:NAD(P)-dependent oxidoreductase [Candidatus Hermodarchaeota archaeon]